ncbi:ABC transporter substrate-binding protein [Halanaerobium kushneri]|uniref:Amino acid/amide ABC transporter substrate-binding protein, HAAT family n=1 Tax=Halanaerobium kushneri TaxID=56779 RepID=A0A1N6S045_9FIRM|nr:ABC transporter substrate-binding protein [Halanaerobium kushneri]SIQ34498.1 amino acid/amide ABC transporter substrate-binding protein, HAAT family [Halanaerobium kushneri]
MRKSYLLSLLVLTVIFTFVLSAGAAEDTVKIGLSAPITGNYAEFGENFQYSVEIAADRINANGGIRGREVEIIVRNSEGKPNVAASIAQEFVQNKEIVAEIGDFTSTSCLAAAPIYERNQMVQLSPTSSHPDFARSGEFMFGIVGTQAAEGPFNAEYIAKEYLGIDSVAVIYINNDWGVSTMENFVAAAEKVGLEVTGTEAFFGGETDFSAILTNVKQNNPEGVYIAAMYNEASQVVNQIDRMEWDVAKLAPSSVFSEQFLKLSGESGEGLVTNTFFALEDPKEKVQSFIAEFRERADRNPNLHAAVAYDSMMLLADAIERAGFDRVAIRDALAETENFEGVTGTIEFTDVGDVVRSYMIMEVKDGDWVVQEDYR